MPENTNENTFEAMAKKFAKVSEGPSGTYLKSLTKAERDTVQAFAEWLTSTTSMTQGSVSSYKTYLAACIVAFKAGKSRKDLTASQRSCMNRFEDFIKTLK